MKYKALQTHCIVRVFKGELKSAGGIIMEVSEREKTAREEGVVIDMGPDMYVDSPSTSQGQVKLGDTVVFARYAGKTLGNDEQGFELRVMNDVDLLAVKIEE